MESSSAAIDNDAIDELISQRTVLRKRKCYDEADEISSSLRSRDIVISDNADGTTTWQFKTVPVTIPMEDRQPRTSSRYRKMLNKNMRRKAVKTRGRDFAKWVMHQFNDFLAGECSTILDIAGGKGEVSYYIASHLRLLSSSSPPPCCLVVDPMPISLSRQKTKDLIRKNAHRHVAKVTCDHQCDHQSSSKEASTSDASVQSSVSPSITTRISENFTSFEEWFQANTKVVSRMPSYAGHFQPIEHFQLAMHLQADKRVLWLDRVTLLDEAERVFGDSSNNSNNSNNSKNSNSSSADQTEVTICDNFIEKQNICTCNQISVPMYTCQAARSALASLDELDIQHIQDYFNAELISTKLSHLLHNSNDNNSDKKLSSSTLLLGFHPDEPTADIVDMALQYSMPFVVVPCCVFPSKFSSRVLKNGLAVRSFDDFILYLKEKDDRIRECVIEELLKPNNIALYMLPDDCCSH